MRSILTLLAVAIAFINHSQITDFSWATMTGTSGSLNICQDIVMDSEGNIISVGTFSQTVDFDPGPGVFELTSIAGNNGYFLKQDTDGNFIWAGHANSGGSVWPTAVVVDEDDNIYIAGYYSGDVDWDPGPEMHMIESDGSSDCFILKLTNDGDFVWVIEFGAFDHQQLLDMVISESGYIYTTGGFWSTVDFDPGLGVENKTSNGNYDIFVHKIDTDGNFVWVETFGGIQEDIVRTITLDDEENVITTGFFNDFVDFNPDADIAGATSAGDTDVFIHKLKSDGSFEWVKTVGNVTDDEGLGVVTNDSLIYLTGVFRDSIDMDPDTSTNFIVGSPGLSGYILCLDDSGKYKWAQGLTAEYSTWSEVIELDDAGDLYLTGYVAGEVDLDPGPGSVMYDAENNKDVFLLKVSDTGEYITHLILEELTWNPDNLAHGLIVDDDTQLYLAGEFMGKADFDPGPDSFHLGISPPAVGKWAFVVNFQQCLSADTSIITTDTSIVALGDSAIYNWLDCDDSFTQIMGETDSIFLPEENGSYALVVNQYGCIDTSACVVFDELSIDKWSNNEQFVIYPNPTSNELKVYTGKTDSYTFSLVDMMGKEIPIDTMPLSNGYLILIEKKYSGSAILSISKENFNQTRHVVINN